VKHTALIIATLILTQLSIQPAIALPIHSATTIAQTPDDSLLTPQQIQAAVKNITVRVTAGNNGGSGVIIAQKGSSYLILTNAHIGNRAARLEI
jgi:hypothetical protein